MSGRLRPAVGRRWPIASRVGDGDGRLGIDIRAQRSTQLTPELVAEMDYIFGLATGMWTIWSVIFRRRGRRFFYCGNLSRYCHGRTGNNRSLQGQLDVYQACRDEIKQGVESIIPFLNNNQ